MIHHINKINDKNHVIISIKAKKSERIQHLLMNSTSIYDIKISQPSRYTWNVSQHNFNNDILKNDII